MKNCRYFQFRHRRPKLYQRLEFVFFALGRIQECSFARFNSAYYALYHVFTGIVSNPCFQGIYFAPTSLGILKVKRYSFHRNSSSMSVRIRLASGNRRKFHPKPRNLRSGIDFSGNFGQIERLTLIRRKWLQRRFDPNRIRTRHLLYLWNVRTNKARKMGPVLLPTCTLLKAIYVAVRSK